MMGLAEPLEDSLSYGSLFVSSDLAAKNGSDFLAEIGIHDTTLEDFLAKGNAMYTNAMPSTGINPRDPADELNCQHGAVVDKISPKNQKHICNIVKTLVGGSVGAVAAIIENSVCSEASSGHPVRCRTIVAFTGVAGVTLSTSEVGDYCTEYLSANDKKCSSEGVTGKTGNKRVNAAVTNTQSESHCAGLTGKCKAITINA
ncbi:hypothetical protein N7463_009751 [Penicillium fimorum]|uniref:Uncharacterized protein n=1 Tax=Penicillium fimorum TaxID=1882269 RepID=A0A9W9XIR7_9EURO|nr:hypothetical protein N7463_009751 [Penicillium fimorum]